MKAQSSSQSLSKERLRLWLKLIKVQGSIEAEIRRRLRDQFATTLPRFDVMSALSRAPDGLKMNEISGLLKVSNGNITGIVDRLSKDGLATRVTVPEDRRAQRVKLTRAGKENFSLMAGAHEQWLNELLGQLKREQVKQSMSLLDSLSSHPALHGADDET